MFTPLTSPLRWITAALSSFVLMGCTYDELPDGNVAVPVDVIAGIERPDDFDLFSSWNLETGWDLNYRTEDFPADSAYFFQAWDTQKDGFLTDQEIATGIFHHYGGDDGQVTRQEFMTFHDAPGELPVFLSWDDNRDGTLDREEFVEGSRAPMIASIWDSNQDGMVSPIELRTRFFQATDVDGDGTIEQREWSL